VSSAPPPSPLASSPSPPRPRPRPARLPLTPPPTHTHARTHSHSPPPRCSIFEGTNDILRLLIAGSGLTDLGKKLTAIAKGGPGEALPFAWRLAQARFLGAAPTPTLPWVAPPLKASAALVESATSAFGDACTGLVMHYKKGLVDQQLALERTAEVAIDLTVCTAALSRASSAVGARGAEGAAAEVALANLVVAEASVRMAASLAAMQAHARQATGSSVAAPAPDHLALERLKTSVANTILKEGYIAEPPLGF
jgi:alkylation response protein AidB-like acyl-CoA dehydrogenase